MREDGASVALDGLSDAARALLSERREARQTDTGAVRITAREGEASDAPLSSFQKSIYFVSQMDEGAALYNTPVRIRLRGELDVAALERSIAEIFRRHEILRSRVRVNGETESQSVMPEFTFSLPVLNLADFPEEERNERCAAAAHAEAGTPFDLATGPFARATLVSLASEEHLLLFTAHHIAFDGWSVNVFLHELSELYDAFSARRSSPLGELTLQYADFATAQQERIRSSALDADLAYWTTEMAGAPPVLELPADRPRSALLSHRAGSASTLIEPGLVERLHALGRVEGTTLFMTMFAAFQTLLSRLAGVEDVVVGIPIAGRTAVETESLLGCFINLLPLRTRVAGDASFRDLLAGVRDASLEAFSHQELPFDALVERLRPKRIPGRNPIAQVLFNFRNTPRLRAEFTGLDSVIEPAPLASMVSDFELGIAQGPDGLTCEALYRADLFDETTVTRWLGHYKTLLEAIVESPDTRVSKLPLLSKAERRHIVADWNVSEAQPDYETCVHVLVEAQVRRTPDAVAVTAGDVTLTYGELNRRANRLARELRARGVGPPDGFVGICMEPCADVVVAVLAVLKAGGACVPLDSAHPAERLAYMVTDSGASVLLTQSGLLHLMNATSVQTICVDTDAADFAAESDRAADEIDERSAVTPDDLVYVAYTSGSTGRPKGAMNTHRGLCNFLLRSVEQYNLGASDVMLHRTRLSFDPWAREIFAALISGARIIVARADEQADPAQLARLIHDHSVTVMGAVPSLLNLLLEVPDLSRLAASVRVVTCGGEAMSTDLQERFHAVLGASLNNHYGPTEAAVSGCRWECERETARHVVPIGRPMLNVFVYILDPEGEPVPIGVTGELYLGGVGVGRGYRNQAELTAERFVPDGFCGKPGSRMYRTGDLARFGPDGVIEFLGRADDQLKLRGIRIEPGEIEAVLKAVDGVRECAVVAREDLPGDIRLVAYIVRKAGHDVSERMVRDRLRQRLLPQMVPSAFVFLDRLPLTSGGKVDRKALPAPEATAKSGLNEGREGSGNETMVATIWSEILGVANIDPTADFFDVGGNSLKATRVITRLRAIVDPDIPIRLLFEHPTIASLAAALAERGATQGRRSGTPTSAQPERDIAPLSFSQEQLWLVEQLEPGNTAYIIGCTLRLNDSIDVQAVEATVTEIVRRHAILRTAFVTSNGVPMQVVKPAQPVALSITDLRTLPEPSRSARLRTIEEDAYHTPFRSDAADHR